MTLRRPRDQRRSRRRTLRFVLGALLLLAPAWSAWASFLAVNGLDRAQLSAHKATVALVRVTSFAVKWRTTYAVSGHVNLSLEEPLFGPRPPLSGMKQVPYATGAGYNSAWPDLGPEPVGSYLVMAWRAGRPCGEGSAVSLGERFMLPLAVSGPADPRVSAVRAILALVVTPDESVRLNRLSQAFQESNSPYLVLFADAALGSMDLQHRESALRYSRLLWLLEGPPKTDEELGWPVLQELAKFPPVRDEDRYQSWSKGSRGPTPDGSWPSFTAFRTMIQTRFKGLAADASASVDLRRWAIAALAVSPAFIGQRRDKLDARCVIAIIERLKDPLLEVRREAVRSLLAMASALRTADRAQAKRLLQRVRQAQQREADPEEKLNLQLRIEEFWERPAAP